MIRPDQEGLIALHDSNNLLVRIDGTKLNSSNAGGASGYVAGATAGTFHTDDKYTGNVGSTGYTLNGVVAALKQAGILAP